MKALILVLVSISVFCGCETLQRALNHGKTVDEVIAERDREERETQQRVFERQAAELEAQRAQERAADERRAAFDRLKVGQTYEELSKSIGLAYRFEIKNGNALCYYDDREKPMVLEFERKHLRLVGWWRDEFRLSEHRAIREKFEREQERQRALQEQQLKEAEAQKAAAWQALGQSLQNLNSQPKSVNCTSSRVGGTVYTNCQ